MRCLYCDTTYAYDEGRTMSITGILSAIAAFPCNLVEITGGEPLLQNRTPELIERLLDQGHHVLLETNGSMDIRCVDPRCIKIVDIKCPGSGEHAKCNLQNLQHLAAHDQLKFVISDRNDYDYARNIIRKISSDVPNGNILLSPVKEKLDPSTLADWIVADGMGARLHLQLHKILWPHVQRGV